MKKYIVFALVSALFAVAFSSCRKDEPLSKDSIITMDDYIQNDFDKWLEANFVNPYNIVFKYRYQIDESNRTYYTIPASYDCAIIMAHIVKYLCIDSYDEVAGVDFTRQYFPKMFFIIGEWEYNNNGTMILGTAEGGKKILLTGVNWIPKVLDGTYSSSYDIARGLNHYYIKTIHHEFTHILNQTKDFPVEFSQITPNDYVYNDWSNAPYNSGYMQRGFISSYAQHSDGEDFAEMLSIYVTNTQEQWDSWMADAGDAASLITAKLDLVKSYMLGTYDINIDQLRATILRRQDEVAAGQVDLTSLTIN
ncbi:MAG: putative zinc-binding metallopeptidase [Bacteroidales bacterium]|jgi:substrate import-associated zinc metallohydrolase lipoprotein|nr:putative zinc-binding metallopeptidase [Bacteroidales bacterium]